MPKPQDPIVSTRVPAATLKKLDWYINEFALPGGRAEAIRIAIDNLLGGFPDSTGVHNDTRES